MPKRKLIEDIQEEEEFEWDKKKILLTLGVVLFLLVGGFGAKQLFLGTQTSLPNAIGAKQDVKGASTVNSDAATTSQGISLPSSGDMQQQLSNIEQQISHLSMKDIASSSPQVQQVIQQIQTIQNVPANEEKSMCQQVCGSVLGK